MMPSELAGVARAGQGGPTRLTRARPARLPGKSIGHRDTRRDTPEDAPRTRYPPLV